MPGAATAGGCLMSRGCQRVRVGRDSCGWGLIWGCLALVFGRNQAACAVEVGCEPLFARYDGLQAGSILDEWFLSFHEWV
jgi:hypothetical protein